MTRIRKYGIGIGVLAVATAGAAGFVWSGVYDVGADTPHTRPVHALLDTVRERSVQTRAARITPPTDLASEARIRQGAGNYAAMCVACHLAPGAAASELSRGLYPAPPNLSRETVDAAQAFWTIKHGIKASGMPAWGHSMPDEYVWNLVAFVQTLPKLDAKQYQAMVDSSDGHSHGGGESMPHGHGSGGGDHHAEASAPSHPHDAPAPSAKTHQHADGRTHVHEPAAKTSESAQSPPSSEHQGHEHTH